MITVKQFWTFIYDTYYPSGGMYDHTGSFDTLEEAIESIANNDCMLAHNEVWNIEDKKLVWKNGAAV